MPVFISYRHTDRASALAINDRLQREQITTYLDVLDAESRTTDDITQVISTHIRACTHLIALVSKNTSQSWWVPFEIGEATIIDRRISTFQAGEADLPEYLEKWPIMRTARDIDLFVTSYRLEKTLSRAIVGNESFESTTSSRSNADKFHADLKARLRRGY